MAIVHAPDSAYATEMTKWEAHGSTLGPGLRPYVKRDWPSMVHRAAQLTTGGIEIVEQQIVESEDQYDRLRSRGFRLTPLEAIAALEAFQKEAAALAAEREYEKRHGLSPQAVAEVNAVEEAAGATHLPTIAETPTRAAGDEPWRKGMEAMARANRSKQEAKL